jgi:hypothetical protein
MKEIDEGMNWSSDIVPVGEDSLDHNNRAQL